MGWGYIYLYGLLSQDRVREITKFKKNCIITSLVALVIISFIGVVYAIIIPIMLPPIFCSFCCIINMGVIFKKRYS